MWTRYLSIGERVRKREEKVLEKLVSLGRGSIWRFTFRALLMYSVMPLY